MDAQIKRVDSTLQLAQHMITTILVSLDTNNNQLFDANVEIKLPSVLPLSRQQVVDNQLIIATAYAKGANLNPMNIYIDIRSIRESLRDRRNSSQDGPLQRRLLNQMGPEPSLNISPHSTMSEFVIVAGFATANEKDAIVQATESAETISNPQSLQAQLVAQSVNDALARRIMFYERPLTIFDARQIMQPPTSRAHCNDDTDWEIDVTTRLGLTLGNEFGLPKIGFLSCRSRRVRLAKDDGTFAEFIEADTSTASRVSGAGMRIRGPQRDIDWTMLSRENVLLASRARTTGWLWWDFCAPPPRMPGGSQDANFLQAWTEIQSEAAQHCCACETNPRIDTTSRPYQQQYTWPLRLENESIFDMYSKISYALGSNDRAVDGSEIYKINPQIRNFRTQYGASAVFFDLQSSALPPVAWDVDELGRTLFPPCPAAHWKKSLFACHLCPIDTYRAADLVRFPSASEAHLRGGKCLQCPPNSVAGYMHTTVSACLCIRSYFFHNAVSNSSTSMIKCVACPVNTYKDTISNTATCLPCSDGLESREGSTDETKCLVPLSIGETDRGVLVYTTILGLLYHQIPVQPAWKHPRAIDQDQTMLCVLVSGVPAGVSLDCGRGVYHNVFAQSPILFSTQANTLRSININSATNDRILSFHGPPSAANRLLVVVTPAQGVDFFVDGVDRAEYKARIKHMSLFP